MERTNKKDDPTGHNILTNRFLLLFLLFLFLVSCFMFLHLLLLLPPPNLHWIHHSCSNWRDWLSTLCFSLDLNQTKSINGWIGPPLPSPPISRSIWCIQIQFNSNDVISKIKCCSSPSSLPSSSCSNTVLHLCNSFVNDKRRRRRRRRSWPGPFPSSSLRVISI